jgi:subfamily B ATP-binding cassette protein MsbA
MQETDKDVTLRQKLTAVKKAARHDTPLTAFLVFLSILVAVLEGFGLTFIFPIIKIAQQSPTAADEGGRLLTFFVEGFRYIGIPFTLEYVVGGVVVIMGIRFGLTFLLNWKRISLRMSYLRQLREQTFESAIRAEMSYFDEHGSDEILNTVITETEMASEFLKIGIQFLQQALISLVYFSIALYIAPALTLIAGVFLGGLSLLVRNRIESSYSIGGRVSDANEYVQETVQATMQGIRDIRLFTMADELTEDFSESVNDFVESTTSLGRNQAAITNLYQFMAAVSVFLMVYLALEFTSLSLGEIGVYLFAVFRLAPRISTLNSLAYAAEGRLPHVVRIEAFLGELEEYQEPTGGSRSLPKDISTVTFDEVSFAYDEEQVLSDVSFTVSKEEFVAFIGHSGAGKSTVASLFTRFYEPDSGQILVDGVPLQDVPVSAWRSRIAFVRQNPYMFNESLRYNLTIGNRDASQAEIDRVCRIARVNEFISDLPRGYDTVLGDDGVRLSGGQRQRVALARALLKDADFLVLDEATSDLDSDLEQQVQNEIEAMDRDYGIIAIAHRLSTVVNADQILTLDDGQIVETGSHDDLVRRDGTYAELYEIQTET